MIARRAQKHLTPASPFDSHLLIVADGCHLLTMNRK